MDSQINNLSLTPSNLPVADPGEEPGLPPLFFDQTEVCRTEKYFLETPPPLSHGLNDQLPPFISRSGSSTAPRTSP